MSAQRLARRRAGKARQRGLLREQVPILVVRNRAGQTTDSVLEIDDKVSISQMLRIAVAAASAPPRPSNVRRRTHRTKAPSYQCARRPPLMLFIRGGLGASPKRLRHGRTRACPNSKPTARVAA